MKKLAQRNLKKLECSLTKYYKKYRLTPRQLDCLHYAIQGMSGKAIGNKLGLSKRTIESNIAILKEKMGCKHKFELTRKIIKDGMLNIVLAEIAVKNAKNEKKR